MTMTQPSTLRLGTRGSLLARTQSRLVADALEKLHPGLFVEIVILKTSGDVITDRPLHDFGGKGLFTKEIELALLDDRVDLAVHSYKDVPVTMPLVDQSDLIIAATPERKDPADVIVMRSGMLPPAPESDGQDDPLATIPQGAKVGTSSLRRRCQLLSARPDLAIEPLRGNIDSRLKKLNAGDFEAMVLAFAGVHRAGLFDGSCMRKLSDEQMLPAPGQGALALQCRQRDGQTISLLKPLNDPATAACVSAERALVMALQGDCHSPIAARARLADGRLTLLAAVGARDGKPPVVRARAQGPADEATEVVRDALGQLNRQGVGPMLAE
jgi:hydroxymethylbilane synthase